MIASLTGFGDGKARRCIGRLLRDSGDDCALLMAVLDEAMDLRPADPMAWVTKVVTDRAGDREAVQRISDEWGLIPTEDLDANHQRVFCNAKRISGRRATG